MGWIHPTEPCHLAPSTVLLTRTLHGTGPMFSAQDVCHIQWSLGLVLVCATHSGTGATCSGTGVHVGVGVEWTSLMPFIPLVGSDEIDTPELDDP